MVNSIFLRLCESVDANRFVKWLSGRPDILLDPLGSGTFMVGGSIEVVEYMREKRIKNPSQFPYCVLITISAEEINIFQEYGNDLELVVAREFVKMIIEETGCKVLDEYGTDWTERVRQEGVGVLYPAALK